MLKWPVVQWAHGLWTPNEAFFHRNPEYLGLGRQIGQIDSWAFGGILGQFISTHFGAVSPLFMFSINPTIISKKKLIFIWDWDLNLNLGRKELGI